MIDSQAVAGEKKKYRESLVYPLPSLSQWQNQSQEIDVDWIQRAYSDFTNFTSTHVYGVYVFVWVGGWVSCSFITCVSSLTTNIIKIQNCSITTRLTHVAFSYPLQLPSPPPKITNLFSPPIILLCYKCYINEIVQYVTFEFGFFPLRSIQVVVCVRSSFHVIAG